MGEVIVVTSGKGGVGKTTVTANLGVGLALKEKKVLLIDLDIGLRNLDLLVGLENKIVYNLVDVANGRCEVMTAAAQSDKWPGLFLLSTAQTLDKDAVTPEQMKDLTETCRELFDYIVLDCPAGIERGFQNAIAGADRAVVVTTPDVPAARDADRVVGLLEEHGIRQIGLVINRIRPALVENKSMLSKEDITEMIPVPVIGLIPDHDQIIESSGKGIPSAAEDSFCGRIFRNVCGRLLGETIEFSPLTENAPRLTWRERRKLKKEAKKLHSK